MDYGLSGELDATDNRQEKWAKQREERGFDDTETWNLFNVVARFVLPRLIRFKEVTNGFPCDLTEAEWDEKLQQMIDAFQVWANCDDEAMTLDDKEKWQRACDGAELFGKYFRDLWW